MWSDWVWAIGRPSSLLLWLLVLPLLLACSPWRQHSRPVAIAVLAGICLLLIPPWERWLMIPLEGAFQRVDMSQLSTPYGLILLGGGLSPRADADALIPGDLNAAGDRVVAAAILAQRWPEGPVILAGGLRAPGIGGQLTEAAAMAQVLTRLGVAPARLMLEDTSRTTRENATNVVAMLAARPRPTAAEPGATIASDRRWALITSAAHMPRAWLAFAAAGVTVRPIPVDRRGPPWPAWHAFGRRLALLDDATREYVGLLVYFLRGDTDALWPPAPNRPA